MHSVLIAIIALPLAVAAGVVPVLVGLAHQHREIESRRQRIPAGR